MRDSQEGIRVNEESEVKESEKSQKTLHDIIKSSREDQLNKEKKKKFEKLYYEIVDQVDSRFDAKGEAINRGLKGFFFGKSSKDLAAEIKKLFNDSEGLLGNNERQNLESFLDKINSREIEKNDKKEKEKSSKVFEKLKNKIENAKTNDEIKELKKESSQDLIKEHQDLLTSKLEAKELLIVKKTAVSEAKKEALESLEQIRKKRDTKIKAAEKQNKDAGKYGDKKSIEAIKKEAEESKMFIVGLFKHKLGDITTSKDIKSLEDIKEKQYITKQQFQVLLEEGDNDCVQKLVNTRAEINSVGTATKAIEKITKEAKESLKSKQEAPQR